MKVLMYDLLEIEGRAWLDNREWGHYAFGTAICMIPATIVVLPSLVRRVAAL